MDYEKKHKEALERARKVLLDCTKEEQNVVEYIYPELKEGEDERVRKVLLNDFKNHYSEYYCEGVNRDMILAWLEKQGEHANFRNKIQVGDKVTRNKDGVLVNLSQLNRVAKKDEKQGEQKPAKNIVETWKDMRLEVYQQASGNRHEPNYSDDTTKMFSLNDIDEIIEKISEQKPTDKVEPKFKVGDWVVHNMSDGRKAIRQIVKMTNKSYVLDGGGFDTFYFNDLENDYHIWTIQDAKDGDVLAFYSEYRSYKMVQVGIIEKYVGKHGGCSNTFKIYVGVNWDNNLQIGQYMGCSDIHPATKEQRDTLMETMADDGYTFDFEKKELKKIEQNSIEPDDLIEESYRKQADDVIDMVTEKPANIIQEDFEKYAEHLLSLSDGEGHGSPAKVKEVCYELLRLANLQQKPWSEEDENAFDSILNDLRQGVIPDDEDMNWLKSIKDRVQPKPQQEWSEEDESILQGIWDEILANKHDAKECEWKTYDKFLNWLKSLKDR